MGGTLGSLLQDPESLVISRLGVSPQPRGELGPWKWECQSLGWLLGELRWLLPAQARALPASGPPQQLYL